MKSNQPPCEIDVHRVEKNEWNCECPYPIMSNANFNDSPKGKRIVLPLWQNDRPGEKSNVLMFGSAYAELAEDYENVPFESARSAYPTGGFVKPDLSDLGFLTDNSHPTDFFPRRILTLNKENTMSANQLTLEQLQALKPGDAVIYESIAGYFDRTFLAIDPQSPQCAMVRESGNVNAPVQVVHHTNLYLPEPEPQEHVVEMFLSEFGGRNFCYEIPGQSDKSFRHKVEHSRKIIDAHVTKDGLLLVKYIDERLEEAAVLAAYENPTKDFKTHSDGVTVVYK